MILSRLIVDSLVASDVEFVPADSFTSAVFGNSTPSAETKITPLKMDTRINYSQCYWIRHITS